jgi:uncharacterized protein YciI
VPLLYLVRYHYTDDAQKQRAQAEVRPAHRAWLAGLPSLVGSGPTADNGAALVFEAASADELNALLDQDPFTLGGFIVERDVVEWNLILGRWAEKSE